MRLDERMIRLIAVGASIAANCQPCLQANLVKALESGANEQEIAEALWIGRMVSRGAASQMDEFATSLNPMFPLSVNLPHKECECA
jgi:AhpD family alkylhydroperoxidase